MESTVGNDVNWRRWLMVALLSVTAVLAVPLAAQEQEPTAPPAPPGPESVPAEDEELEERLEELRESIEETVEQAREETERARERVDRVRRRSDNQVSFGNTIWIREDEVASDVVAIGAGVEVDGEVLGDVVSVGGSARIDGRVTGTVTAVGGGVELGPEAEVLGDVTSVGSRVESHEDATVLGTVSEVAIGPGLSFDLGDWDFGGFELGERRRPSFFRWGAFLELSWKLVGLAFWVLLCCLLLFLFPAAVDRVRGVLVREPLKSGLIGVATPFLLGPAMIVVTLLLVISIVGILLLPLVWSAVLLAMLPLTLFGYSAAALAAGDLVRMRFGLRLDSRYLVLLVGVVVLQIAWFVGEALEILTPLRPIGWLFGLFGFLVLAVGLAMGVGATLVAAFAARGRGGGGTVVVPPPPPPPAGSPAQERAAPVFEPEPPAAAPTTEEPTTTEPEAPGPSPAGGETSESDDESPR